MRLRDGVIIFCVAVFIYIIIDGVPKEASVLQESIISFEDWKLVQPRIISHSMRLYTLLFIINGVFK